jgi:hypothetical protein
MRRRSGPPDIGVLRSLEPADGALDNVALPLERSVLCIQLTNGLLIRDAPLRRDEGPESMIVDKLPNPGDAD